MKKTKMVCTLGPATSKYEEIVKLLKAGMNVARLNMSHGDLDWHQQTLDNVKRARNDLGVPCAIMVDTCGPELRIGTFKDSKVCLVKNHEFVFSTREVEGDENIVNCPYPSLLKILTKNQKIFANNGLLEFVIKEVTNTDIICKVVVGGEISNHKSIFIPRVRLPLPFISQKDEKNIEFAAKNDVEYISASFVNRPEDVIEMRECIKKYGGRQEIISKIESLEGINKLDSIINVSDGIMVARGDMGTEVAIEHIPQIQKDMIQKCIEYSKKVIVATEMLESMTYKRRPTRAETTDVSQAIYDKAGATMLSGETASGSYPFESAITMTKIALATEKVVNYDNDFAVSYKNLHKNLEVIAYSSCATARAIGAKAIVCFTDQGKTAEKISKFRPKAPIVAITHDIFTYNKLALAWGVIPVLARKQNSIKEILDFSNDIVKAIKVCKENDDIVITLGLPLDEVVHTNTIKVCNVK